MLIVNDLERLTFNYNNVTKENDMLKKAVEKFRYLGSAAAVFVGTTLPSLTVGATTEVGTIEDVVNPVVDLINSLLTPILAIVGALGSIYCVFLGIKFAKAEEPQDREKAKSHLKNAIIGFILIFVLMLALKLLMPVMIQWVKTNS